MAMAAAATTAHPHESNVSMLFSCFFFLRLFCVYFSRNCSAFASIHVNKWYMYVVYCKWNELSHVTSCIIKKYAMRIIYRRFILYAEPPTMNKMLVATISIGDVWDMGYKKCRDVIHWNKMVQWTNRAKSKAWAL